MDFRKVIAFGKSSFVVSLPKDWMQNNKIVKGDVVFLEQEEDKLVLTPKEKETKKEEKRTVINIDNKNIKRIKREIYSAYLNYNDYIVLQGKLIPEHTQKLNEIIHNMIALEVLEQDTEKIVARDFLKLGDVHVKDHIKKADIVVRSMLKDFSDINFNNYDDLIEREEHVDRIFFLVLKVLKAGFNDLTLIKKLGFNSNEFLEAYNFNSIIRSFSKHLKSTIIMSKEVNTNSEKEIKGLIDMIHQYYLSVMKVLFIKDEDKAYGLSSLRDKNISIIKKTLNKGEKEYAIKEQMIMMCQNLHEILRRIYS